MQVKKTFERKGTRAHHRRYFAKNGLDFWYVFMANLVITSVLHRRERPDGELEFERVASKEQIPAFVSVFIKNDIERK
jgi:hypothetical protein